MLATDPTRINEVCAYCREPIEDTDPDGRCGRLAGGRRGGHRFEEIEMDARAVELLASLAGDPLAPTQNVRPNFWHGFDVPVVGGSMIDRLVRVATDDWGENLELLLMTDNGLLIARVDFHEGTPAPIVDATFKAILREALR